MHLPQTLTANQHTNTHEVCAGLERRLHCLDSAKVMSLNDADALSSAERFISIHDGTTGSLVSGDYKPVYEFDTDRTLNDLAGRMQGSLFLEDHQLYAKRKNASGLWQLAVCSSPLRQQYGSGFFLSQPFTLDAELQKLFKWKGSLTYDRYILFASADHVFNNTQMDAPMFMAEVAATSTQHVFIPRSINRLLARPSEPQYENVSTKMDSPRLAAAAGQGFRPLPTDVTSGLNRSADFVIGILPCHDMWFKKVTPTAVVATTPYFFVPSASPAVAGANDIMVTTGYPSAATPQHLEDVYGVDKDSMKEALTHYQELLKANNLSASAGDIIAVGRTQVKHRCSTAPGMSGGPLWPLDAPCTFKAIHTGSSGTDIRANFNRAYNAHADLFVLNYTRFVLPVLCKAAEQDWPQPYMREEVTKYLQAHKELLQQHWVDGHTLWTNAEAFFDAHGFQH